MATKKTAAPARKPTVPFEVTWDGVQKLLTEAVSAEQGADKKWTRTADCLWMLGVRPSDFEPVQKADGKMTDSDRMLDLKARVRKAFGPKVDSLLSLKGAALSGLSETERFQRRYYDKRVPVMVSRVIAYLKKHEENDRGPVAKATLAESIVKILKVQISRIKKADEEKIDFDIPKVIEHLNDAIAELT